MIYSISMNLIVIKMFSDKHTFHFIVGSRKVRSRYLLCFLLCEIWWHTRKYCLAAKTQHNEPHHTFSQTINKYGAGGGRGIEPVNTSSMLLGNDVDNVARQAIFASKQIIWPDLQILIFNHNPGSGVSVVVGGGKKCGCQLRIWLL